MAQIHKLIREAGSLDGAREALKNLDPTAFEETGEVMAKALAAVHLAGRVAVEDEA